MPPILSGSRRYSGLAAFYVSHGWTRRSTDTMGKEIIVRRHNLPVLLLGMVACFLIVFDASAAPRSDYATVVFTVTDSFSNAPISGIKVVIATNTAPKGTPGCYDCHIPERIGTFSSKVSQGKYEHKFTGLTDTAGVVTFQVPAGVRILIVVMDPIGMYDLETLERISIRKAMEYRFDFALDSAPVI